MNSRRSVDAQLATLRTDVDTLVSGAVPLGSATPQPAGVAAAGVATSASHEDHVHLAQTTITGNAGTATLAAAATVLATPRNIAGVAFDGSAAIAITTATVADSADKRYCTDAQKTVIGNTSGTNTGDQTTVSGNSGTATKLATARAINAVSFDGTADITVTAAAGTLTGATLNSGVTASSLTSVGTLGAALNVAFSVAGHLASLKNTNTGGDSGIGLQDTTGTEKGSIGYAQSGTGAAYASKVFASLATGVPFVVARGASTICLEVDSSNNVTMPNGTLSVGGVAVPTISSSSTFTNKTFTTGNGFSGTPTISGAVSFSGNPFTVTGTLQAQGATQFSQGIRYATRTVTAATITMGVADGVIYCDATANAQTGNLQAVSAVGGGRTITWVKTDASVNTVTVTRASTDTLNSPGAITQNTYVLALQGDHVTFQVRVSGGGEWWKVD